MLLPPRGTPAGQRKNRGKFAPVFGECFESTKLPFVGAKMSEGNSNSPGRILTFVFSIHTSGERRRKIRGYLTESR